MGSLHPYIQLRRNTRLGKEAHSIGKTQMDEIEVVLNSNFLYIYSIIDELGSPSMHLLSIYLLDIYKQALQGSSNPSK